MRKPSQASSGNRRTRLSTAASAEEDKLNRHWRGKFITALAETSNVAAAAKAAGVAPGRPYKVRRMEPDFARLWQDALCEGYENLELEVLHRLRFGDPKGEAGETGAARRYDNGAADSPACLSPRNRIAAAGDPRSRGCRCRSRLHRCPAGQPARADRRAPRRAARSG